MRDSELDLLVVQYLKKRKLDHTLQVFQREGSVAGPAPNAGPGATAAALAQAQPDAADAGLARGLLGSYAADAAPQAYLDSFDALLRFMDASLDLYKPELRRVVYPVFVHTHLRLVARGAGPAAAELLRAHHARMTDAGGRRSAARAHEVSQLQGIALPSHLDTHPFAKAAMDRAARPLVRMCAYSFELLMHFLHGNKLWLLLAVINEHIRFEVYDGPPVLLDSDASAAEAEAGLLQGRASESAASVNQGALVLSLLKGEAYNLEDAYAVTKLQLEEEAEKAAAAAAAAAAASAGDGADGVSKPAVPGADQLAAGGAGGGAEAQAGGAGVEKLSRRAKAARDKAVAAVKAKRRELEESRVDPQIPLLPFSDAMRREVFESIENRADVSPSEPPSCCFFTLTNSRQSCCSLAFDPWTRHAAAGFADSSIRLFNLQSLGRARTLQAKQLQRRSDARRQRRQQQQQQGGEDGWYDADEDPADEQEELEEELADLADRAATHLYGHTAAVHDLDFTADGQLLLSAAGDGAVRVWSPELRRCLAAYRGHVLPVWAVAACPNGGYFVSGGADRTARIWATEVAARPLRVLAGHASDVDVVGWHPNSHYVATGGADRSVRLWDVRRGRAARVIGGVGGGGGVTALAFAPDGRHLAAAAEDGSIGVYDIASAKRVALLEGHEGPVWSLSYSRGAGSVLASGGADLTLRLWSAPAADNSMVALVAGAKAAAMVGSAGAPGGARLSEDGSAAGGGGGGGGQQAQLGGGGGQGGQRPYQQLRVWRTRATPVAHVAFSPRNLLLAGGAWALRPLRK